jgi:hypothetical protein
MKARNAMPAILTTAVVAGALLFVFALCDAMSDADDSTPHAIDLDDERRRRRSATVVRLDRRPFDWARDCPEPGA